MFFCLDSSLSNFLPCRRVFCLHIRPQVAMFLLTVAVTLEHLTKIAFIRKSNLFTDLRNFHGRSRQQLLRMSNP